MPYDKALIAGKLRRWEKYLESYRLPMWDEIPDFGLYMEQVISLLKDYLDYMPPELKEAQFITGAAINNYVRKRIMPEPIKKKYYRVHIAYLIMICSLKQSISIPTLQTMLPVEMSEEELKETYNAYARRHHQVATYFNEQIRIAAGAILDHDDDHTSLTAHDTEDLIRFSAILAGFSRLLAEKLLLLNGKTLENGGSIEIEDHHARKTPEAEKPKE
ncbi:MAG: DUF1836 domain-containing protein [Oscillospiraceae bacterium]|nr:DUF1836 domain-containing protein [Oscillospiraceae bacterium]